MKTIILILSVLAFSAVAFQPRFLAKSETPLVPVKNVILEALNGPWYELRRLGFDFETDTACSKVNLIGDLNNVWQTSVTARAGSATGKSVQTNGTITPEAKVVLDVAAEGKFIAKFGEAAPVELYIFALHTDYKWALFGSPDRTKFWLLSRKSGMDDNLLELLENKAADAGFDVSSFAHVDQGRQCFDSISK